MLSWMLVAAVLAGGPTFDLLEKDAVAMPGDRSSFEQLWRVLQGEAESSDNEFEQRRAKAEVEKQRADALKSWYMIDSVKVEVSEFNFKTKTFILVVDSMFDTPLDNVQFSLQDIASRTGSVSTATAWLSMNRQNFKTARHVLKMKSDAEAEQWKSDHNTDGFSAKLVCKIGKTWFLGTTGPMRGLTGLSLRSCLVRFLDDAGEKVADVRL